MKFNINRAINVCLMAGLGFFIGMYLLFSLLGLLAFMILWDTVGWMDVFGDKIILFIILRSSGFACVIGFIIGGLKNGNEI